jgi:DNA-binding GntR family transcriptional regulator
MEESFVNQTKYLEVAELVRAQINGGKLVPGEPAPSGAELARLTGYCALTCRKALHILVKEGALVAGTSPNARPRVPSRGNYQNRLTQEHAARTLAQALAARRNAAKMTQPDLARVTGMSVTSIGHAETGRLWHSRRFWIAMDEALKARGELLSLHDAYRATGATTSSKKFPEVITAVEEEAFPPTPASIMILWSDGAITSIPMERKTTP